MRDVSTILGDRSASRTLRLSRLQGWRGPDAACAAQAQVAQRIGPALCAVGALTGAATSSPAVLAVFAATAALGTAGRNHPFEWVHNRWAAARGRPVLPPNRAAKRLGCAIGTVFLGGAALAYAAGAATVGFWLAVTLGVTATFVAVTGICVPSILFTLLWGAERGAAPSLWAAAARSGGQNVTPASRIDPQNGAGTAASLVSAEEPAAPA